jgi:hypothetical protein
MIKKNIQCVKRVGYLLANSKMEPREIAALTTATHGGKNGVANAINDYRYFVDAKLKRSNLIEQYINLDDGVRV